MGGVHGWEEENPITIRDYEKYEDYEKLGEEYKAIWIYQRDDSYAEERIIKELHEAGLPINEYEAQHYRNRKVTRYEN